MISRLRGELVEVGEGRAVVDCGGVGYEVHVPESALVSMGDRGDMVELYVRQIVREDDISLYGFPDPDSRKLFDQLREVKGCGARISLSILGALGAPQASAAIAAQDARALTAAPGVGPKLGERIVLELKDKVGLAALGAKAVVEVKKASRTDELVDALMALGYRRGEAEPAADEARHEAGDLEAQILAALRRLQR